MKAAVEIVAFFDCYVPKGVSMPLTIKRNPYALAVKVALLVWEAARLMQGAESSFLINGPDQYRQTT
jgi:hypothetical protein